MSFSESEALDETAQKLDMFTLIKSNKFQAIEPRYILT